MTVETKYFKILVTPIFDVYILMYMFFFRVEINLVKYILIRVQHTYSARQEKNAYKNLGHIHFWRITPYIDDFCHKLYNAMVGFPHAHLRTPGLILGVFITKFTLVHRSAQLL